MNEFLDRAGTDLAIGVDLGGTNLRAALYRNLTEASTAAATSSDSAPVPDPVALRKEPVGDRRDPETIVARLSTVVAELKEEAGVSDPVPVGVGFAGMLRGHSGYVVHSPNLYWKEVPFGDLLRAAIGGDTPVCVHNDVSAITFGEYRLGAAAGFDDVLVVFFGTGVGGGAVIGGQLFEGATNCSVEIGHAKVVTDETARVCGCGLRGCLEAYLGGVNLQQRVRAELSAGVRSIAATLAGGPELVHPGHLDSAAGAGDDYALELYDEIAPLAGIALGNAVTLLNPACLVLGGGVLSRTPVLREHIIAGIEVIANPPAANELTIVDAALGDDGGLVGAALLAGR